MFALLLILGLLFKLISNSDVIYTMPRRLDKDALPTAVIRPVLE